MPSPLVRDTLQPQQIGRPMDVNEHFVRHPSNGLLAKFTVNTKDRTPEQTAEEIAKLVGAGVVEDEGIVGN